MVEKQHSSGSDKKQLGASINANIESGKIGLSNTGRVAGGQ